MEEDRCDQCGQERPTTQVRRATGPLQLCQGCRALEEEIPKSPIAAAWDLDQDGETVIERVWPVAVNLHRYHLDRVVERGIEVPLTLEDRSGEDDG